MILSTLKAQPGDNEVKLLAKILVTLGLPWNGENGVGSLTVLLEAITAAQTGGGGTLTLAQLTALLANLPTSNPGAPSGQLYWNGNFLAKS